MCQLARQQCYGPCRSRWRELKRNVGGNQPLYEMAWRHRYAIKRAKISLGVVVAICHNARPALAEKAYRAGMSACT